MTAWLRNIHTPAPDVCVAIAPTRDDAIALALTHLDESHIRHSSLVQYWADDEGHEVLDFGCHKYYIVLKGDNTNGTL